MSRKLSLLTTIVLSLLFVAFAACGGGDDGDATTPSGTTTSTQAATGTPAGASFSGSATATVLIGDQTLAFKDGRCDTGDGDAWLAVNIGQPGGDNYFGLVVGAHPAAPEGTRSAKGGGEFTGDAVGAIVAVQGDNTFTVSGVGGGKVTVDADLKGGDFQGTTIDGEAISGSFQCQ